MSKTITYSRRFPVKHPKAGQPTYFVEKIWEQIGLPEKEFSFNLPDEYVNFLRQDSDLIWQKSHTIRSGHRWKVCDYFSPRVWSDKPYCSKQIVIAPDIQIVKIWNFEKHQNGKMYINNKLIDNDTITILAKNDGLLADDFLAWFPQNFSGQILCWNNLIKY